ncbi:MAG: site-specific integrase [Muribaculaceae bacterium]|nr:site-specific integrase [Muribaculaceae bacterium]
MASVHISFTPLNHVAKKEIIVYKITHQRNSVLIKSDVIIPCTEHNGRLNPINLLPKQIRKIVQGDIERINSIIAELEIHRKSYTVTDIAAEFEHYLSDFTLKRYTERIIKSLKKRGKTRTAETYRAALNSFMKFRHGKDIHLRLLTSETVEDYEAFLIRRGLIPNSISFYMRILRAIYNRAVDEQITEQTTPFKRVYTGVDSTVKRALPLSTIKTIKELNLSNRPSLEYARDIFLLSFYLRGMSFIDMAYLRKSDMHDDIIYYRRRKTGQLLTVRWTCEMEKLTRRYTSSSNPFLLPILTNDNVDNRNAYRNASYNINRSLKTIAQMIGLKEPLTLYCARHSWASVAKAQGIPLTIISEGMGHRSESTTRIYLASLDTSAVDRANHAIIRLLN